MSLKNFRREGLSCFTEAGCLGSPPPEAYGAKVMNVDIFNRVWKNRKVCENGFTLDTENPVGILPVCQLHNLRSPGRPYGKTYCKRDYVRLFGIKCAQCQVGFSSSDLVMRARESVYHIECFRCSVCSRQLLPGDEFSLREHELLCRADHGLLLERAAAGSPRSPGPLPGARGLHLPDTGSGRQPSLRTHVHKQAEKTTRVRTVLNEKQLHTLRTCYAANPRPDALMKEQLVEMTGLSPRVIRVWFQNKRCKDKKKSILMKQLQQQQLHSDKASLQGMTGTPLVAGSPIRHENAVQGSAVEVQTYQPPWKALSEFALQSDLDQPAFQQLVSFSESGSLGNSSGSDVTSLSSQLPDTPNSMVPSPVET
ncbi:insulin protein enhancer protein ISL-2 [Sigmodon hispidus]